MLKGDTRDHLKQILTENDDILFWLDAHWSGGETYGEEDECPLLEELGLIFKCTEKKFIVLIDDARLFLAPPPLPHDFSKWPTIQDIIHLVPNNFELTILNDVIYIQTKSAMILKILLNKKLLKSGKKTEIKKKAGSLKDGKWQ